MSNKERAIQLLDAIDDEKMIYVVGILENLTGFAEVPNAETMEAFEEVDEMKRLGTGEHFSGTTKELLDSILEG